MTKIRKKLIEVALPLEAINIASAREKSIRHGHPSTLHLWWARRPLAAARAVIFAQMVDDPSSWPDLFPTEKKQEKERQRLFKIIEELVQWENTTNEGVLQRARDAIWESWRRTCAENADHPRAKEIFRREVLPAFHDPFAGGGALPIEAQRLGLESYASDLNPVAVLINKAMIELPSIFLGRPPINVNVRKKADLVGRTWHGAQGLEEDVRYFGQWMRNEAEIRIGNLYPKVAITSEVAENRADLKPYIGQELTVIAWLWARTVKSPNPAFSGVYVPLVSNFMLSTKAGREAYVQPIVEGNKYRFTVQTGTPGGESHATRGTKSSGSGSSFLCLLSDTPIPFDYIRDEAKAGRIGTKLMAVVADGPKGKIYLPPTTDIELAADSSKPVEAPDFPLPDKALGFRIQEYGMKTWTDLFTQRQLVALTTFSDLIGEAREKILSEGSTSGDFTKKELYEYANAIQVYLAFAVDRCADYWTSLGRWQGANQQLSNMYGRHAIPMVWDFPEANPFSKKGGSFDNLFDWTIQSIPNLGFRQTGRSDQADASTQEISVDKVVSTDPPYYDNIGYADLSDFFYVWLRRALRQTFPNLFSTVSVPKVEELVATPFRHGSKQKAEVFFLEGMQKAMHRLAEQAHSAFPVTIYYAFKQSETESNEGTASTGWETFLDAVIRAGFVLTGTWPMRSEMKQRMIGLGTNALASNIILVCRRRPENASTATRREFLNALKTELPLALSHLQDGNVAPSDLAQSAIGPGMAVYTRYSKVIDAEGNQISVRSALALINQTIDEYFAKTEGDFDAETRWAISWFEQIGFEEGEFGVADVLARAKGTAVNSLDDSGIVRAGRGKVRLLRPSEYKSDWDPSDPGNLIVWEIVHRLIYTQSVLGEQGVADMVAKLGSHAETARELCYRLYTISERKKRASDAMPYNALVQSWPEIVRLSQQSTQKAGTASDLFGQE